MKKRQRNNNKTYNTLIYILLCILITSCSTNSKKAELYNCPMHPEVTSNKAGDICPKCKMMLELVKTDQEKQADSIEVDDLLQPTNQQVLASIGTVHPEKKTIEFKIQSKGTISYDPRSFQQVSSLYAGRIEKLYAKYAFQTINKGDKLFEVYSPEMVTVQQNLIFLLASKPVDEQLVNATKQKLLLLGMDSGQLNELVQSRQVKKVFTVYSPSSGYLTGISTMPPKQSTQGMGTAEPKVSERVTEFKEGAYIEKGQTIFTIVSNKQVWAVLKIYERDFQSIEKNLKVEVATESPEQTTYNGRIDYVEPFNESNNKMFSIRVYLNNEKNQLKIGQLVNANIFAKAHLRTWIPKTAVINLGMTKVVFKKQDKLFHALAVTTGTELNDKIELLSGVKESDEIAQDAQYLMDSESFIVHKKD